VTRTETWSETELGSKVKSTPKVKTTSAKEIIQIDSLACGQGILSILASSSNEVTNLHYDQDVFEKHKVTYQADVYPSRRLLDKIGKKNGEIYAASFLTVLAIDLSSWMLTWGHFLPCNYLVSQHYLKECNSCPKMNKIELSREGVGFEIIESNAWSEYSRSEAHPSVGISVRASSDHFTFDVDEGQTAHDGTLTFAFKSIVGALTAEEAQDSSLAHYVESKIRPVLRDLGPNAIEAKLGKVFLRTVSEGGTISDSREISVPYYKSSADGAVGSYIRSRLNEHLASLRGVSEVAVTVRDSASRSILGSETFALSPNQLSRGLIEEGAAIIDKEQRDVLREYIRNDSLIERYTVDSFEYLSVLEHTMIRGTLMGEAVMASPDQAGRITLPIRVDPNLGFLSRRVAEEHTLEELYRYVKERHALEILPDRLTSEKISVLALETIVAGSPTGDRRDVSFKTFVAEPNLTRGIVANAKARVKNHLDDQFVSEEVLIEVRDSETMIPIHGANIEAIPVEILSEDTIVDEAHSFLRRYFTDEALDGPIGVGSLLPNLEDYIWKLPESFNVRGQTRMKVSTPSKYKLLVTCPGYKYAEGEVEFDTNDYEVRVKLSRLSDKTDLNLKIGSEPDQSTIN
jgi:hypothetical protein